MLVAQLYPSVLLVIHKSIVTEEEEEKEEKEDGLSGGAIAGIIIGCVGFVGIATGFICYLIIFVFGKKNKRIDNDMNQVEIENDEIKEKKNSKIKNIKNNPQETEKRNNFLFYTKDVNN